MKITEIEITPIYPAIAKRNERHLVHFQGFPRRTVFVVHTDAGLVGYGDLRGAPPPRSDVESLIGHSPFDFINANLNPGLGGALYDVMGKFLDIPAYKLMGQKVRDAVPVAAWTRPKPPADFRDEVLRAVDEGYTILKMHTRQYYDVFEQTRAAEEVAPQGFRMHYDFNGGVLNARGNRTLGNVLPMIRELETSPIVGWIEDPLQWTDISGWRALRERTRVPLVMHMPQLGGLQEALSGAADAYMVGERGIGDALARGAAHALANVQTIIQLTGGTLTKALALHMAAVMPGPIGHSVNLDDQYDEDITTGRIPVVEGSSPVPEGPGLGVEVDEKALARAAANGPPKIPRHVGVLHRPGGHRLYTPSFPDVARLTGYEEGAVRGINLEIWEDDGSQEFEGVYARVHREGSFLE